MFHLLLKTIVLTFTLTSLIAHAEVADSDADYSGSASARPKDCNPVNVNGQFEAQIKNDIRFGKAGETGIFDIGYFVSTIPHYTTRTNGLTSTLHQMDASSVISVRKQRGAEDASEMYLPAGKTVKFSTYSSSRHHNGKRYNYTFTYLDRNNNERTFDFKCYAEFCSHDLNELFQNSCAAAFAL